MDQRIELLITVMESLRGIKLISSIIEIVALWKIFNKFGEPGWKALIPVYNWYILFKYSWKPIMFWVTFICFILATGGTPSALAIPILLVTFVFIVIGYYKLAKRFGHGIPFTLGLVFLTPIFLFILAFGEDQYLGPQ